METKFAIRYSFLFTALTFGLVGCGVSRQNGERSKNTESQLLDKVSPRTTLKPATFQQNVDHFGQAENQTFDQRYWFDSEYATNPETAPVIFHICGEGPADQGYFLNDNAIEWAKTLGAHLVVLEHRYYGKSQPFGDLTTEHLHFLTLDNIMEDFANFQKSISTNMNWKGKWVSVGGSYSGTLSALYRFKHPELVAGALASSAPMISGLGREEGTQSDLNEASYTDLASDNSSRQWVYQSCTTFGFWQANGETIDASTFEPSNWLCQQLFGNVGLVDKAKYNQMYSVPFATAGANSASKILFTYGSKDVWTNIGLTQQGITNPNVMFHMIDGAKHHYDLNAPSFLDTKAVKDARALFVAQAKTWLQ